MSPKKKKSSSPTADRRRNAKEIIARAARDHANQRLEGEDSWDEMSEMQRWMWIGAVVSKDAGEADHAAAIH